MYQWFAESLPVCKTWLANIGTKYKAELDGNIN